MILQQTWERFKQQWQAFALTGLGPVLLSMGMGIVMGIVALVSLGPAIFMIATSAGRHGQPTVESILGSFGGFALFMLIAMVISVLLYGFMYGGLVGAMAALRRGETVEFGTFWAMGRLHWKRVTVLSLLYGLITVVVLAVTFVLLMIPILGWFAFYLIQTILLINVGIYGTYLIVQEEMSATDALARGFKAIFVNVKESLLSSLMLIAFGLVFMVLMVIGIIPLIGWAIAIGVYVLGLPLLTYYFIERFETNVRHNLQL